MICFFLLFLSPLLAAPIGNPSSPFILDEGCVISDTSWSNFQGGILLDYLIYKRMHSPSSHKSSLGGSSEVATMIWSIRERFNLQVELGSGQFDFRFDRDHQSLSGGSSGGVLWSGTGKCILFQAKDTMMALQGSAGGWDWMKGTLWQNDQNAFSSRSYLRYWQIALGVTQQISFFFPYVGLAWNRTRFHIAPSSLRPTTLHAWHGMGPFGGCTLSNGNRFLLNLEWRGWFEEGVSLSFQLRF